MTHNDKLEILLWASDCPRPGIPPLLLLHDADTAAWCWQEHFLPYFAKAGFAGHALMREADWKKPAQDIIDWLEQQVGE